MAATSRLLAAVRGPAGADSESVGAAGVSSGVRLADSLGVGAAAEVGPGAPTGGARTLERMRPAPAEPERPFAHPQTRKPTMAPTPPS
jgi:hypothetical protein